MDNIIDFTDAEINYLKMYGGRNGGKLCVVYNGDNYMLKFPPKPSQNSEASYINSCVCEYVACHIFEALGFESQTTLLGKYNNKIVVACKDFETDGFSLFEFAHLKNTIVESPGSGYGTELSEVLFAIKDQSILPAAELEESFWNMFVVDALVGNFDRHNGNWGFLINKDTKQVRIAPVFDCGSCLYPQLNEDGMKYVLDNRGEIEKRLFIFPNSSLKMNDVKINYAEFLANTEHEGCVKALGTISRRIDLDKINHIINDTPLISDINKLFFITMIKERKERIIDNAIKLRNESVEELL